MQDRTSGIDTPISGLRLRQALPQVLTFFYVMLALAVFLAAPFLAASWMEKPFIGAFIEQNLMINDLDSSASPSVWPARSAGLSFGYQIIDVNGTAVTSPQNLTDTLGSLPVGAQVMLKVRSPQGSLEEFSINLITFPDNDRWAYHYVPYIIGLFYLVSALWVFFLRRHTREGRAFVIFTTSVAICTAGLFDLYSTHAFTWLWTLSLALAGGAILTLPLLFPGEDPIIRRLPVLRWVWYGISLGLGVFSLAWSYNLTQPLIFSILWRIEFAFSGLAFVIAICWLGFRRYPRTSYLEREQIRLILISTAISFAPIAIWLVLSQFLMTTIPFSSLLFLPMVAFPLASAYTIQRYRLLSTDYILSRAVLYTLMAVLVAVGYGLMVAGFGLIGSTVVNSGNPIITGILVFLIALLFLPARQALQNAVDRIFFRGERVYQDRIRQFAQQVSSAIDLASLLKQLRRELSDTLAPGRLHIYILDPFNDQYTATPDESGRLSSDLRFSFKSMLVKEITEANGPLVFGSLDNLPESLVQDRNRISLLGTNLFIPLPGTRRLAGWIALGQRISGEYYTSRELGYLRDLASQAALAIERAQVLANMENRVKAMNVLSRVAQGVNVTLTLDDLYELIYTQVTQIIPADDFQLALLDSTSRTLLQAFYVENNERFTENDGRPLVGAVLEDIVVKQRKAIVTDDYATEAQKRGFLSVRSGLYAWACVPLNTGAETVGVLSLGNRKISEVYTTEEINLLQSIADQVAGAIVKARLLLESERRAVQMATLNEVNRQLTQTLDVEPLLQTILEKATMILNCEAGSLLMVDEETRELVFKATVGPVAEDLVNRRMPLTAGLVGKSATTREPVISNDVTTTPGWFNQNDQATGFVTRALLVVPMIVKDKVIGVLEVINKRDGSPFNRDDTNLLLAFAAQAAVALENARLYTLTDQELAARVEELSVMQRIDRELNTTLDTRRAMQITLEWAVRQTAAPAGLVGLLVDNTVRVQAQMGYSTELDRYENGVIPLSDLSLDNISEQDLAIKRILKEGDPRLLSSAKAQVLLPIQRESGTIGLVLLESENEDLVSETRFGFLQRLADHAAVSIANAQLYAAVQAANLAKSEFVSFVAHELKNPMTSIKGYNDLLAAGAVGPINEAQASFLSTIRSNIDRMNTLISDLNDLSKIEAGRLKLEFNAVQIPEAVEEVVRSTKKQIEEKTQQLLVELPENLGSVWADRTRLVQVLVNLVSNAHKYTESGGEILIGAEQCNNQWDPQGAKEVVHLWVKDNGIGISEEDQKKIFQKFFRSDDPKTREVPGTGLGLNITRSLVEMQGGKIWFESEHRKGTTFHITVPIAE